MCGIVGAFGSPESVVREQLERGIQALRHRGPNAQAVWINNAKCAGLGHARLSIIDFATGQQPIGNEDGKIQAAVNGEFYDFERIRDELSAKGHVFTTKSDSEILVHLYEEHGKDCLAYLRGEFAFILWDERTQMAFAARDRFGIKPLYYAQSGNRVYFASEAKALFRMGVPARWDKVTFGLNNYFVMPEGRTLFGAVQQIPPANYLILRNETVRTGRYWDMDYPAEDPNLRPGSDGEYEEILRDALNDAIRVRLRADVPVGCYLSGGIDSSAILGLAAAQSSRSPRAFSIAFDHEVYDETPLAAKAARKAGAEFQCVRVHSSDLWDHFPEAIYYSESIALNSNGVAKFLLSKAVRDAGYRVVLTGEGADEILGGYPHFVRDSILFGSHSSHGESLYQLAQLQKSNPVFQGLGVNSNEPPWLERVKAILGYIPSLWSSFFPICQTRESLFSDEYRSKSDPENPYEGYLNSLDCRGQMSGRSVVNQSQYLWSKTWLPEYILKYLGDRMEMAHSIEGRVPFLDHHLFETVRRMPVNQKIRGTSEKNVLKRAVGRFVPDAIVQRQKHPFAAPPSLLDRDQALVSLVQDLTASAKSKDLPFYDRSKIRKVLDEIPGMDESRRKNLDAVLVSVASTYILHNRFALSA